MRSTLVETFWILALAVIGLFAFFVALGAFSPRDVAGLSIVVGLLAVAWLAHAWWDSRHRTGRDVATIRARERRGF
jgi:hypothetical protein